MQTTLLIGSVTFAIITLAINTFAIISTCHKFSQNEIQINLNKKIVFSIENQLNPFWPIFFDHNWRKLLFIVTLLNIRFRTNEILQNKSTHSIMLADQIYNEKNMYVYRKINPQEKLA